MLITEHARERWKERFGNYNMDYEYSKSRRLGVCTRKRLNAFLAKSPMKRARPRDPRSVVKHYYLISPCKAIFVMAVPETIVTVYPLPPKEPTE